MGFGRHIYIKLKCEAGVETGSALGVNLGKPRLSFVASAGDRLKRTRRQLFEHALQGKAVGTARMTSQIEAKRDGQLKTESWGKEKEILHGLSYSECML